MAEVECPLCAEEMTHAYAGICGHAICVVCIHEMLNVFNVDYATCPVCQTLYAVSRKTVRVNFLTLAQLNDIRQILHEQDLLIDVEAGVIFDHDLRKKI